MVSKGFSRVISITLALICTLTPIASPIGGGFSYTVRAAETGLIGALAGSLTIWDLITSTLAGAGLFITNEAIQDSSIAHLASPSYSLEALQDNGIIDCSSDDPVEWDWSGLKTLIEDWQNYQDSVPLTKIQNAAGEGFEDLWLNVIQKWVEDGKIAASSIAKSISVTMADLCSYIGDAFSIYVGSGTPLNTNIDIGRFIGTQAFSYASNNASPYNMIGFICPEDVLVISCNNNGFIDFIIANRSSSTVAVRQNYLLNGFIQGTNEAWMNFNANSISQPLRPVNLNLEWQYTSQPQFNSVADARVAAETFLNGGVIDWNSEYPEILEPAGAAGVNSLGGTWAPSPYVGGIDWPDSYLQPIPDGVWRPAVDDVIDLGGAITPEVGNDIFSGVVDPYIVDNPAIPDNPSLPIPTIIPYPTTAVGEGTWDSPIVVTGENPISQINEGEGQLEGITAYFPFCLPSDFVYIAKLFNSGDDVRKALVIDWPLEIPSLGLSYRVHCDFSVYDSLSDIIRMISLLSFCVGLLFLTKQLVWK